MITPTQWNLGSGTKSDQGIAQNAMIGSTIKEGTFLFSELLMSVLFVPLTKLDFFDNLNFIKDRFSYLLE
jgi:hypothetical protein